MPAALRRPKLPPIAAARTAATNHREDQHGDPPEDHQQHQHSEDGLQRHAPHLPRLHRRLLPAQRARPPCWQSTTVGPDGGATSDRHAAKFPLKWSQIRPSRWGHRKLTSPSQADSQASNQACALSFRARGTAAGPMGGRVGGVSPCHTAPGRWPSAGHRTRAVGPGGVVASKPSPFGRDFRIVVRSLLKLEPRNLVAVRTPHPDFLLENFNRPES
jgi:hypothetical protein